MPIKLNSDAFMKFTNFAATAKSGAVRACLTETKEGEKTTKQIVAATTGNKFGCLFRTKHSRDANNAVRDEFKKAIADMFGGEDHIPKSVQEKMQLEDFDVGKPLTARRISAVADEIRKIYDANVAIKHALDTRNPDGLPDGFKAVFESVFEEVQGRVGDAMPLRTFQAAIMSKSGLALKFAETSDHVMTRDEFRNLLGEALKEGLWVETEMFVKYLGELKKAGHANVHASRASAKDLLADGFSDFTEKMEKCKTPEEFRTLFENNKDKILARADFMELVHGVVSQPAETLLGEELRAQGVGSTVFTKEDIGAICKRLNHEFEKLEANILKGKVKASSKEEVEAARKQTVKDFVAQRKAVAEEAMKLDDKEFGIPLKKYLYKEAYKEEKIENYKILEFKDIAANIDVAPFKAAVMAKPFSLNQAATEFGKLCRKILNVCRGMPQWMSGGRDSGVDDRQGYMGLITRLALGRGSENELTPFVRAFKVHAEAIQAAYSATLDTKGESSDLGSAATVVDLEIEQELAKAYFVV